MLFFPPLVFSVFLALSACRETCAQYPPHHPRSDSFIDFFLPKVLYAFFSLAVGVAVALLRHPYLARLDRIDWLKGRFEVCTSI